LLIFFCTHVVVSLGSIALHLKDDTGLRSLASSRTGEEEALLSHRHRGVRHRPRPQDDCNDSILFDGNTLEQLSVSFANALRRFAESTYRVHSSSSQSIDVTVSALSLSSSSSKDDIALWRESTLGNNKELSG